MRSRNPTMKLYAFAFDKCPVARSIVVERSRTLCLCVLRRQELEDSVFVARVWDHTTYRMGPILLHLDTTNFQRPDRYGYSADIEKATAEFVILYHVTMVRSALQERFLPYKVTNCKNSCKMLQLLLPDVCI
ncbi:uncharacterized protein LOC111245501 isoform X2 [Varroa destructor]|uniref:Uncharacterized protein n=1 Tax=Varroa destructor TaxID=109461 RepID=A0A7M7JQK7_VARDE|nr:uncharacterized protein LOC111245501 isoform X2 [Varroa destructor]